MIDMARKALFGLAVALAAGAAVPASAITVTSAGVSGDPSCSTTGSLADTWGDIDVLAGASFNAEFVNSDVGGNFCFSLNNTSTTAAVVTLAVATVNQGVNPFGGTWGFTNGVQLVSEQLGTLWTVAQGAFDAESFVFTIAAGDIVYFDWIYGDPYTNAGLARPEIDFAVFASPVPLPAGGLLLIGALGGLAILRRRKTLAA
jgi:hypothetical protein